MTTYSIREFKAKVSEILRNLNDGEEVIITRLGKPCGKLIPVQSSAEGKPSARDLRGSMTQLPYTNYEDFLGTKALWDSQRAD